MTFVDKGNPDEVSVKSASGSVINPRRSDDHGHAEGSPNHVHAAQNWDELR